MGHYWLTMIMGIKKIRIKEKGKISLFQNRKTNKVNRNRNKNHFRNRDLLIKSKDRHNHYNPRMFLIPTNQVNNNKIRINKMRIGL